SRPTCCPTNEAAQYWQDPGRCCRRSDGESCQYYRRSASNGKDDERPWKWFASLQRQAALAAPRCCASAALAPDMWWHRPCGPRDAPFDYQRVARGATDGHGDDYSR